MRIQHWSSQRRTSSAFAVSALYHRVSAGVTIDSMYETFDHTADLGLRIRAPDLDTLFAEAGQALFAVIVEDLNTVEPRQRLQIDLDGEDRTQKRGQAPFRRGEATLSISENAEKVPDPFSASGEDREYLLFDWLKELLYHFDSEHLLFGRFEVHVGDTGLSGTAWGEPVDLTRHTLLHEVKAITYHGLSVEHTDQGWVAEVIVDI